MILYIVTTSSLSFCLLSLSTTDTRVPSSSYDTSHPALAWHPLNWGHLQWSYFQMKSHTQDLGRGPEHRFLFWKGGAAIQPTTASFTNHPHLVGGGPWSLVCKSRGLPERTVPNPSPLTFHETLDWHPPSSSAKVGAHMSTNQFITETKQPVKCPAWCMVQGS